MAWSGDWGRGQKGKGRNEAASVREATRGDHRDADLVSSGGNKHEAGNVALAGVTGALEAVNGDSIDAEPFRLEAMPDSSALVYHLDPMRLEVH